MNNSWGCRGQACFSRALEDAIKQANARGILFAAAAGNNNVDTDTTPHYPSNYEVPNVISVMATDQQDRKATFSNRGRRSVDLAAPGVGILSTVRGNDYRAFSGTSMATPFVAGAAALLKGVQPQWGAAELKQRLIATVDKVAALRGMSVSEGRLNLQRALPTAPACPKEPSLLAYNEFYTTERKTISANANVLSVTFTLPSTMYVTITANGSADLARAGGANRFTTGIYSRPPANIMWTGSLRRGNFAGAGRAQPISTSFSTRLARGTHTMFWKLWPSSISMLFHSGNLTVEALPCTMGGKLRSVGVEAEDDPLIVITEEGELTGAIELIEAVE